MGPGTNNALGKLNYQKCTYKVQGQEVNKDTWDKTVSNEKVHVTIIEE